MYASKTAVSVARSKMEIERTLAKYRAAERAVGEGPGRALVQFRFDRWHVLLEMHLPDPKQAQFKHVRASRSAARGDFDEKRYEQACRQRWRALNLVLKAKLEAVESGIVSFETEFLSHIVIPGGGTVGKRLVPQLAEAYETGTLRPLLPSTT